MTRAVLQKDTLQVERLLQKGEQRLKEKLHPDPIIGVPSSWTFQHMSCLRHPLLQLALALTSLSPAVPYYPGGSLFQRNPPMPKVCMVSYQLFKRGPLQPLHGGLKVDLTCIQMQQHLDFGREGYH